MAQADGAFGHAQKNIQRHGGGVFRLAARVVGRACLARVFQGGVNGSPAGTLNTS